MKKLTAEVLKQIISDLRDDATYSGQLALNDYILQALEIALPILEQQERGERQERGEWIEWKGGEQPVNGDVLVETKWSDGSVSRGEASDWRWDHRSLLSNLNLIAYRIIPERATNQNGEQ